MNVSVRFLLVSAAVSVAAIAQPARAQSPAPLPPFTNAAADSAPERGPTLSKSIVGVRAASVQSEALPTPSPVVQQRRGGGQRATTLMIVGLAALLVGAVIDDDAGTIIMVGGAVIGLYGLYLFLQ